MTSETEMTTTCAAKPLSEIELLHSVLTYDPATGHFYWKARGNNAVKAGQKAGSVNIYGYIKITVRRKGYSAHRLAWLFVHGSWPKEEVDHINGDPADNRITNLRVADRRLNTQNMRKVRKDSTTGVMGARKTVTGKFVSGITANGVHHHLGTFLTAEQAHSAYMDAKRRLHQGNTL